MSNSNRKTLIQNVTIVRKPWTGVMEQGDILIVDDRIQDIGTNIISSDKKTNRFNGEGLIAIPGFIQTHIHLCQTLFRHLANDLELLPWLESRIWPLEAAHDENSMRISVQLGLAELMACGTTTILDMGSTRLTHVIAEEIEQSGFRANVGVTLMDSPDSAPKPLIRPVSESLGYFEELKTQAGSRYQLVDFHLAPRFGLSVTPKGLQQAAAFARSQHCLLHTHASENRREVAEIKKKYGMGNIAYYHQIGLTGEDVCLAHCIWIDENEISILQETGTRVLHCPTSNLKLGSGIAPIPDYLQKGILCSIGADGAPCNNNLNIFREMRMAALIQAGLHGAGTLSAEQVLRMATIDAARTLHLENEIGSLEVGKKADIVLLDLDQPHTLPNGDFRQVLLYAAGSENVSTVFIDGRMVLNRREFLTIDSNGLRQKASEECGRVLKRANL